MNRQKKPGVFRQRGRSKENVRRAKQKACAGTEVKEYRHVIETRVGARSERHKDFKTGYGQIWGWGLYLKVHWVWQEESAQQNLRVKYGGGGAGAVRSLRKCS